MNIAQKMEIVKRSVDSIATHYDVDTAVLKASLDLIAKYCADQSVALDRKVEIEIGALTSAGAA